MAKTTNKPHYDGGTSVPKGACLMQCPSDAVRFAAGAGDDGQFEIMAYDGGIAEHWFWDQIAIDLEGMKFASKRLPVLDSHQPNARLGFTTENSADGKVTFKGQFLANPTAQELRADMQKGFPMQASLWPRPLKIERLEKGATATVNGRTMKGPGAIFRQTEVMEVSMCTFGAMKNTKSTAFADTDTEPIQFELVGDNAMADKDKPALTLEQFKAEHPDLYTAITAGAKAEGQLAEKDRFAALQRACGDDHALAAECFMAGLTVADALTKRNEKLAADLRAANEKLAAQPPAAADPIAKAKAEFKQQPAPKTPAEQAAQFDEATATDDQLKAHFAATPDLRDRFSSAQAYVAHVRHPPKR